MNQTIQKPWQPPADYQPATSALEGITVFAPRPPEEKAQAPVEYKCPNCGATTRYDVAAGGVACEYCGYAAPVQEARVGITAPEYEFTLETLSKAETGWGIARQELHCESCGASLVIPPGALTTSCPFCASNSVNVREAPADVLRPRFLVPFRVKADELRSQAGEWLGKGWFHPPELKASSILERFSGLYMPFWTFHAKVNAVWRAEVGYERQDRYFDAGSHSWKTRVRIDWRWENGQVSQETDNLLVAGTHRVSQKILSQVRNFNLDELVSYSPDYLAGWQAQTYDIGLTDAWNSGKELLRENARDGCYAGDPVASREEFLDDSRLWRRELAFCPASCLRIRLSLYGKDLYRHGEWANWSHCRSETGGLVESLAGDPGPACSRSGNRRHQSALAFGGRCWIDPPVHRLNFIGDWWRRLSRHLPPGGQLGGGVMIAPAIPQTDIAPAEQNLWQSSLQPAGCPQCRQAFLVAPDRLGKICPSCAKGKLEVQPALLRPEPPELIRLPQHPPQQLIGNVEAWLKPVWLKPAELDAGKLISSAQLVYWPTWLVDCNAQGSWQAEVGFDYQVKSSQESYQGDGWQSRDVIETRVRWEPRLGELERRYENISAGAMRDQVSLQNYLGGYPPGEAIHFEPAQIENAILRVPDLTPDSAWPAAQSAIQKTASLECQKAAGGQHIRNFTLQAEYHSLTWTQLLQPYYVTFYPDEEGNRQLVYLNPHSGKVSGMLRASQRKGWLWTGIAFAAGVILVILAILCFALAAVMPPAALLGLPLLLGGIGLGVFSPVPVIWAWQWNQRHKE